MGFKLKDAVRAQGKENALDNFDALEQSHNLEDSQDLDDAEDALGAALGNLTTIVSAIRL